MLVLPIDSRDHSQGADSPAAELVEYGDYESPACAQAHTFLLDAQERLGAYLRLTFRHFPMTQIHPHAQHAAEAAEAAGSQGRFWAMHGVLFEHQGQFGNGYLVEYADALGLDTMRFLRDMAEHVHAARVSEQMRGGIASGVEAAPGFFLNGVRIRAERLEEALLDAIVQAVRTDALTDIDTVPDGAALHAAHPRPDFWSAYHPRGRHGHRAESRRSPE